MAEYLRPWPGRICASNGTLIDDKVDSVELDSSELYIEASSSLTDWYSSDRATSIGGSIDAFWTNLSMPSVEFRSFLSGDAARGKTNDASPL